MTFLASIARSKLSADEARSEAIGRPAVRQDSRSDTAPAPQLDLPSGALLLDRIRVMGILNTTPDSFYDGGRYGTVDAAVTRAMQMAGAGADIVDVGGERAGPGEPVSVEEELRRVVPVIEAMRRRLSIPISVDTFKPQVARAAIQAGADIVNSIGGLGDPAMRRVAAEEGAAVVVMHIQGQPRVANPNPWYEDVVTEVERFLVERTEACIADGIPADRIVVDPGPGFGKTTEHDLSIIRALPRFVAGRYPVLLAASRKKFIGEILGLPPEDRLEGSLAVVAWGALSGVRIVRVHDVRASSSVCRMIEAVLDPDLVEVS